MAETEKNFKAPIRDGSLDSLMAGDDTPGDLWERTKPSDTNAAITLKGGMRLGNPALSTLADADLIPIFDVSAEKLKRATRGNLLLDLAGAGRTTETVKKNADDIATNLLPPGVIFPYGGAAAPTGFLMCNGAAVSRTTYAALFAVIGTAYGVGNGTTTFNVPNSQGVGLTGVGSQDIGGRTKTGPTRGEVREDAFQSHIFFNGVAKNTYDTGFVYGATTDECPGAATRVYTDTSATPDRQGKTSTPKTDGVNGAPRTGAYTRGPEVGVNFIIKT